MTSSTSPPERILGDYEILSEIARGGMGIVFKARERAIDRVVALKVLPVEYARDRTFAERLKQEAQAVARLNHPNIVKIHAFGECRGVHYIAMQYVQGHSVNQVIRTQGRFDPEQALVIIREIADGLILAHGANLIHRDIKPQNIMLEERGRSLLLDFGLARPVHRTVDQTARGVLVGTPLYMSPEQIRGGALDARTDIYSWASHFSRCLRVGRPLRRRRPRHSCTRSFKSQCLTYERKTPRCLLR